MSDIEEFGEGIEDFGGDAAPDTAETVPISGGTVPVADETEQEILDLEELIMEQRGLVAAAEKAGDELGARRHGEILTNAEKRLSELKSAEVEQAEKALKQTIADNAAGGKIPGASDWDYLKAASIAYYGSDQWFKHHRHELQESFEKIESILQQMGAFEKLPPKQQRKSRGKKDSKSAPSKDSAPSTTQPVDQPPASASPVTSSSTEEVEDFGGEGVDNPTTTSESTTQTPSNATTTTKPDTSTSAETAPSTSAKVDAVASKYEFLTAEVLELIKQESGGPDAMLKYLGWSEYPKELNESQMAQVARIIAKRRRDAQDIIDWAAKEAKPLQESADRWEKTFGPLMDQYAAKQLKKNGKFPNNTKTLNFIGADVSYRGSSGGWEVFQQGTFHEWLKSADEETRKQYGIHLKQEIDYDLLDKADVWAVLEANGLVRKPEYEYNLSAIVKGVEDKTLTPPPGFSKTEPKPLLTRTIK